MVVKIFNFELPIVLSWQESEESPLPIKKIRGKTSPTTQPEFIVLPRYINITCKMSREMKKEDFEPLYRTIMLYPFYDYDDSFIDFVSIQRINVRWEGDEDHNYPWYVTLELICFGGGEVWGAFPDYVAFLKTVEAIETLTGTKVAEGVDLGVVWKKIMWRM